MLRVDPVDPDSPDARALIARHLAFCRENTPAEAVFATDGAGLTDRAATMVLARLDDRPVGIGAVAWAERPTIAEVKSMHVVDDARGSGAAAAILRALIDAARCMGATEVRLETGSQAAFAAARAFYEREGFTPCGAFADYPDAPTSAFYARAV